MKPKTRFLKMYYKLPYEARRELIFKPYSKNPMSLAVCYAEVRANTRIGKRILKKLGYEENQDPIKK